MTSDPTPYCTPFLEAETAAKTRDREAWEAEAARLAELDRHFEEQLREWEAEGPEDDAEESFR